MSDEANLLRLLAALAFGYLNALPQRDALKARITELWNYPKVTEDVLRDKKIYYHAIGTPQSADRLIYDRPEEPMLSGAFPSRPPVSRRARVPEAIGEPGR